MAPPTHDLALDAVRCLVLYSLAEVQAGYASTIRVTATGTAFSVADDGRGHAIDRIVSDSPYLKLIYTQLDFPFGSAMGAPVQLQGIGMSLLNTLCSQLAVSVRKREASLRLAFENGRLVHSQRIEEKPHETGNEIAGTIRPRLQGGGIDLPALHRWLIGVQSVSPSLKLLLNGQDVQATQHGAA